MLNMRLEGDRDEIHAWVAWLRGQGAEVQIMREKQRDHVWHLYTAVPAVPGYTTTVDPGLGPIRVTVVQGRALEAGRPRRRRSS